MTRQLILALLIGTLLSMASVASARTTWEATTDGSPVATEVGIWTEAPDERTATLDFLGGHLIGEHTTFLATYRSPWVTDSAPRFEAEFEVTNVNEVGASIPMRVELRHRFRGRRWSDWFGFRRTLRPGFTQWGGAMGSVGIDTRGVRMQYEWRLQGKVTAPTYLHGSASVSTG